MTASGLPKLPYYFLAKPTKSRMPRYNQPRMSSKGFNQGQPPTTGIFNIRPGTLSLKVSSREETPWCSAFSYSRIGWYRERFGLNSGCRVPDKLSHYIRFILNKDSDTSRPCRNQQGKLGCYLAPGIYAFKSNRRMKEAK